MDDGSYLNDGPGWRVDVGDWFCNCGWPLAFEFDLLWWARWVLVYFEFRRPRRCAAGHAIFAAWRNST